MAMRERCDEYYEDITLADFRHVLGYFATYNNADVREVTEISVGTPGGVRGVKISCLSEIKLNRADAYVQVEVPGYHPIRSPCPKGDISPISQRLGMPLLLWKFPHIDRRLDPRGWNGSNPDAAFLMLETDPARQGWG